MSQMKSLEDANKILDLTRKLIDCPDCDELMEDAVQLQCGHIVRMECLQLIHYCSICGRESGDNVVREDMKQLCDILKKLHSTFKIELASITAGNTNRLLNCNAKPPSPPPASASSDKPELPEYNAFDQLLETLQEPSDPHPAKRAKKAKNTYGRIR